MSTEDADNDAEVVDADDTTDVETEDGEDGSVRAQVSAWFQCWRVRIDEWSLRQRVFRGGGATVFIALVVLVAVLPGSVLGLVVNDTATFSAAPAAPDKGTVAEVGYESQSAETVTVERQVSVVGQERTIAVRNHQRVYRRNVTVQNETYLQGLFVTVSTPAVRIAGDARNPIADSSHQDVLERFGGQLVDGTGNLSFEPLGEESATIDGQASKVSVFRTSVTLGETARDVAVYVGSVRSEGDIVIVLGVHPMAFPGQRVSLFELLYSVSHPHSGSV
jgi:hypothetical protein